MRHLILVLALTPAISWASVSNFNDMIAENSQAQREIQQTLKVNDESTTLALGPNNSRKVVMDSISYNAPTSSKGLRFKKEVSEHTVSSKKEMNRLAKEFKSIEREL